MASNARVGKLILIAIVFLVIYYFFWVAIWPFMLLEEGNMIHSCFPSLNYAFLIPAVFGVVFIGSISSYIFYHLWDFLKIV